jgi:hypothetical protein
VLLELARLDVTKDHHPGIAPSTDHGTLTIRNWPSCFRGQRRCGRGGEHAVLEGDGGVYVEATSHKQAKLPGMTIVCPLHHNAAPSILPGDRPVCRRGRDHCEGRDHPPKQACQRRGWSSGLFHLVGGRLSRRRSWPWQPTVYTIRVVVTEPTGLRALDCTQPQPC